MKKQALMITCLTLALVVSQSYPVKAESFEGREDEMNQKCSVIYDKETQKECQAYKDYLLNKKNDADQLINDLTDRIASVQGDIGKIGEAIEQNNKDLIAAQKVLDSVDLAVSQTNASIQKLGVQIKEKEESIKERDRLMKERLIEKQPYIGSNNYIDFIMGSTSFTDLLRRTAIVGELNSYEREQIDALNKEKEELNTKKEEVTLKKELLEVQKSDAEKQTIRVKKIKEANETLAKEYQKNEANLLEEKRRAQVQSGAYASSIPNVDMSVLPPNWGSGEENEEPEEKPGDDNKPNDGGSGDNPSLSTGFIRPVIGTSYYSAGTWYYPGGGVHLGMDLGTYQAVGLPVVAPATGIVVAIHDGVPNHPVNSSGLGDWSGYPSGGGNTLHMIVNVNGASYGISFYHLSPGMFNVSVGSIVKQGQTMAHTGHSGNTSGPHCHIEMNYLGNISINEAVQMFNNYGKDYFYGNYNLSGTCENKSAPCLVRPESYIPH